MSLIPSGSQQKAVLARCLMFSPQLIIMDNPAQSMCADDKTDIYRIIYNLADKGMSVIIISEGYNEIFQICDRILKRMYNRMEEIPYSLILSEISDRGPSYSRKT